MSRPVTVIGVDGGPLSELAKQRIAAATMVVGAARHLDALPTPVTAERVVLGDLTAGLDALAAHSGPAVVLAPLAPKLTAVCLACTEPGIVEWLKGKGHDVHDGRRIDWEEGDALIVENGCVHQHFNDDPDGESIVLVMKAKPLFLFMHLIFQKVVAYPPATPMPGHEDYTPPTNL